jgi:putative transposase
MDLNGIASKNIWNERFWKTCKYNGIYLNSLDTGRELFERVKTNIKCCHLEKYQGIAKKPNDAYYNSIN